jgi:murein DD-endopeptidase MepM/ murein hydrolase activator NlpD
MRLIPCLGLMLALGTQGVMAQPLMKPVDATCISSPFGPRVIPQHPEAGTFHYGVDFPAPEGSPVWATASGTVMKVQHRGIGGLEVLIKSGDMVSIYSHLASVSNRIIVGQTPVTAGELVGYVGRTGVSFGPHLYFGVLYNGIPTDPAPLLGLPRCGMSS